ncbi:FAD-dependent monooxygenase [Tunturibacter psychrotolerans]|uniref:FAD-dependent monooxygenase n=1 Tax=Tunturiibacter psychrotolerans TaxID=3069686 RepID=A0AAU7ZRT2_9BACT
MKDFDIGSDKVSAEDKGGGAVRRTSVLVVGAGPTGLLLASELRRRGVPCHLIDARPGPLHWDRATVVHPRSLQIFESLGLVDKLLDVGCRQRVIKIYSGGNVLGMIDLSTCGSVYGFNLGLSEDVTESILTEYLVQQGGEVNRSCRLVGLTPYSEGVLAEIERDGERYQVDARWVVGCDGIHSATRELSGIGFEGHKIAKQWAVFDATAQGWSDTYEGIFAYHDLLPIIMTALPGKRWRVYLRPSSEDSDIVADATSTLRVYAPAVRFVDVENPTRFNCYTKVASRFRSGAVFLAGDSAHLCSPSEGHGMNCGIQDAFNLAWKLALVHDGVADSALLDSYEAERRPIAEMFTQSGDDFEQAQTMTDPTERDSRDQAIKAMLADPDNLHQRVMAETELNLEYSRSPIIMGDANDDLAPGYRLPDTILVQWAGERSEMQPRGLHELAHRARHTLMLLAGPKADRSALVELHAALQDLAADSPLFEAAVALGSHADLPVEIGQLQPAGADLLGIKETTLLVVRPDGYVGLRSDQNHLGALENYRALVSGSSRS